MTKVKRNLGRGGILWVALAIAVVLAAGFIWVNVIEPNL